LQLKIPTVVQGPESLAQYGGGVFEARDESTTMDIIKFIRKVPLVFCIVNFEATIRRNTSSSAEMQATDGFHTL
jgi:hypothetical protein